MTNHLQPGVAYVIKRLKSLFFPPVWVTPSSEDMIVEKDVEVRVRDGAILRANVFRPKAQGKYPVILCAHPYRKDRLPKRGLIGYRLPFQYRAMNHPAPYSLSDVTSWEAPDPVFWVSQGYALVNVDMRGFGKSPGLGELMSDQEAEDYFDVIEWAGQASWSNERVGLNGVSYLAISQYKVAALHPPHLAAICPWEGFSDFYKDFAYPGGIREDGFSRIWSNLLKSKTNIRKEQIKRPLRDDWYKGLVADLSEIKVPALICGSFSDHSLHSRGAFRVFREISSPHKWLYTHRGGKWAVYYSEEAKLFQLKFFDHFLKREDNGMLDVPPVRLEVRESADKIHSVRMENEFPPSGTEWVSLYLQGGSNHLLEEWPRDGNTNQFEMPGEGVSFYWYIPEDIEISGPMKLKLYVELQDTHDANLFVGVRKFTRGKQVVFNGSYGFAFDMVTKGWQKVSLSKVDQEASDCWGPVHDFALRDKIRSHEIIPLEIALLPSSTLFRKGDVFRLDIQGHWFFNKNILINGPAYYEQSGKGKCVIHSGGHFDSHVLIPIVKQGNTF